MKEVNCKLSVVVEIDHFGKPEKLVQDTRAALALALENAFGSHAKIVKISKRRPTAK